MTRKYDFLSRCHKQADDNMRAGDYSKAMQSLLKVDAKINVNNIEQIVAEQTVSRNVAFKAARLGDSTFDRQSEILMTEAATVDSPSQEDDFDDAGCNAELYASSF